jgi:hypothetical protein
MEPFLIYTATNKIAAEKADLTAKVTLFQNVYNAIKALGVTPSLQEIEGLLSWTVNNNGGNDFEYNYILNKLLDAAAPYSLNGVQLQKSKVKEMISPPNVTALKTALSAGRQVSNRVIASDLALISLNADTIAKVANTNTTIETRNTHYTASDASTTRALEINAICDLINSFDTAHGKPFAKNINSNISAFESNFKGLPNPFKTILPGIEYRDRFIVSLKYIRTFEATNPA